MVLQYWILYCKVLGFEGKDCIAIQSLCPRYSKGMGAGQAQGAQASGTAWASEALAGARVRGRASGRAGVGGSDARGRAERAWWALL